MAHEQVRVELNDRIFMLDEGLAEALATRGVIHVCRACDPAGNEYHLDPDHTVDELLAAGAEPWTPAGRVNKTSLVRQPIFLAHHESGGGRV